MPGFLPDASAKITAYLMSLLDLGSIPSQEPIGPDDWPIYVSQEPDYPDNAIMVFDTSPVLQGRVHNDGEVQERHGIQVVVRGVNEESSGRKMREVSHKFDVSKNPGDGVYRNQVIIDNRIYLVHSISRESGPFYLGKDRFRSFRDRYSLNVTVSVRDITSIGT